MLNFLLGVVLSSTVLVHVGFCAPPPVSQNLTISAIRLNSQSPTIPNSGRVELRATNGVWGTVCINDWSTKDLSNNAMAVCFMLGYRNGGDSIINVFGSGAGNYVIGNMSCPVGATSLYQCPQQFLKTCGQKGQLVQEWAVHCNLDPLGKNEINLTSIFVPTSVYVPPVKQLNTVYYYGSCTSYSSTYRLVSGDDPTTASIGNGYVQVLHNGSWSFISASNWDQADAIVFCRELCYGSALFTPLPNAIANSVPSQLNPNIQLLGYDCLGNESRLRDCRNLGNYGVSTYGPYAGVQCDAYCPVDNTTLPDVSCSTGSFDIFFSVAAFHFQISASDILHYNNFNPSCLNITCSINGTRVILSQSPNCLTLMMENSSHIIYTNEIRLVLNFGPVVTYVLGDFRYKLVCFVSKEAEVSGRFQGYGVENNATLYDSYNYSISMSMYDCCGFTSVSSSIGNMYMVEIGQLLNVAVQIDNYDNKTKLVISSCTASPLAAPSAYVPSIELIQNKCPVAPSVTMFSLDNQRQGFQVDAFAFTGYSMVYLTCKVYICLLGTSSSGCDRTCPTANGRRKRSLDEPHKEYTMPAMQIMFLKGTEYKIVKPLLQQLGAADGQGSQGTNSTTKTTIATTSVMSSETSSSILTTTSTPLFTSTTTTVKPTTTTTTVKPTTATTTVKPTTATTTVKPTTTTTTVKPTTATTTFKPTTATTTVASFPDSKPDARTTSRTTTVKIVPVSTDVPSSIPVSTTFTSPDPTTATGSTTHSVPNATTTAKKQSPASSKKLNEINILPGNTNEAAMPEPQSLSLTSQRGSASVVTLHSCARVLVTLFVPVILGSLVTRVL